MTKMSISAWETVEKIQRKLEKKVLVLCNICGHFENNKK